MKTRSIRGDCDALKQVLDRDFAVILLDVNMPGIAPPRTHRHATAKSMHVPLTKSPAAAAAPARELSKPVEVRRILIVEDHADTAQTLSTLIRLDGHEVHHASDGFAALEIAPTFRPDVALVDIGLPGMDGFEIARRMRQLDCGRHCLLVAVTGYGQERDRLKALEAGFDHHLVKPVNIQVLSGVIASRQREAETQ